MYHVQVCLFLSIYFYRDVDIGLLFSVQDGLGQARRKIQNG